MQERLRRARPYQAVIGGVDEARNRSPVTRGRAGCCAIEEEDTLSAGSPLRDHESGS